MGYDCHHEKGCERVLKEKENKRAMIHGTAGTMAIKVAMIC
jgi:hypothetical protein